MPIMLMPMSALPKEESMPDMSPPSPSGPGKKKKSGWGSNGLGGVTGSSAKEVEGELEEERERGESKAVCAVLFSQNWG